MRQKIIHYCVIGILTCILTLSAVPKAWAGTFEDALKDAIEKLKEDVKEVLGIIDFHFERNIVQTDERIVITTERHIKRNVTTEIIRKNDLKVTVDRFIENSKRSVNNYFRAQESFIKSSLSRLRHKDRDNRRQISNLIQDQKSQLNLQRRRMRDTKRLAKDSMQRSKDLIRSSRR